MTKMFLKQTTIVFASIQQLVPCLEVILLNFKNLVTTTRFLSDGFPNCHKAPLHWYMGPIFSHNTGDHHLHVDLLFWLTFLFSIIPCPLILLRCIPIFLAFHSITAINRYYHYLIVGVDMKNSSHIFHTLKQTLVEKSQLKCIGNST